MNKTIAYHVLIHEENMEIGDSFTCQRWDKEKERNITSLFLIGELFTFRQTIIV